jgi:hypothetical protein
MMRWNRQGQGKNSYSQPDLNHDYMGEFPRTHKPNWKAYILQDLLDDPVPTPKPTNHARSYTAHSQIAPPLLFTPTKTAPQLPSSVLKTLPLKTLTPTRTNLKRQNILKRIQKLQHQVFQRGEEPPQLPLLPNDDWRSRVEQQLQKL